MSILLIAPTARSKTAGVIPVPVEADIMTGIEEPDPSEQVRQNQAEVEWQEGGRLDP